MSLSLLFNVLWFTGVVCALSAQVKVLQVCVFSPASGYIGKKTVIHIVTYAYKARACSCLY